MTAVDILWLIFEIGINLFQGFAITWFLDRILVRKSNLCLWGYIGSILGTALCLSSYLFFPMPANDTWIMLFPLLYAFLFYRNTLLQKLFWVAITYLCLSGISYFLTWIAETFFSIDLSLIKENSVARVIFVLTANLLIFIIYSIIPNVVKHRLEQPLPLALLVVIVLLLLLIGDAQFAIFDSTAADADFLSQFSGALVLVITILTVVLYFILSKYAREAAEKQLLESKIKEEMSRVEELNQVSESLHTLRHNLLNHLHIASDLMQKGSPLESQQYLKTIESNILQVFSTGCPALDSALYIKQLEMQQRGILFHAFVKPMTALPVTAYELCTIVSNLLDNAMEAADRFPDPPADFSVTLNIYRNNNMLFVECFNQVWEASLKPMGESFLSSKTEEGHGLGLPAIEKILDRMNAQGSFTVKDGIFRSNMILPYFDEIGVHLSHIEAVKKRNEAIRRNKQSQIRRRWRHLFRLKP